MGAAAWRLQDVCSSPLPTPKYSCYMKWHDCHSTPFCCSSDVTSPVGQGISGSPAAAASITLDQLRMNEPRPAFRPLSCVTLKKEDMWQLPHSTYLSQRRGACEWYVPKADVCDHSHLILSRACLRLTRSMHCRWSRPVSLSIKHLRHLRQVKK